MKYNPRQNGVVERFVAETKRVLMKWLHGDVSGWEYYIPAVQMGLNDRILLRHNSCPFSLMFGRRMNGFCRQQNPSSFYFWDSYLRITIQKSICESITF